MTADQNKMATRRPPSLVGQPTASACPRLDRGPVPGGSISDGPVGIGQQLPPLPLIDGAAGDAESVGDVGQADDVRVWIGHGGNCRDYLLTSPPLVRDNLYMTDHSTTIKPSESNTMFELHCTTCGLLTRDFSHWSLSRMAEMHERPNATLADAPDEPEAGAFLRPDEECQQ